MVDPASHCDVAPVAAAGSAPAPAGEPWLRPRLAVIEAVLEASLVRGLRLQLALNRPLAYPFAYDALAGGCTPTLARFVEERIGGWGWLL